MADMTDDDGFERSLRYARMVCAAIAGSSLVFAALAVLFLSRGVEPHESPVLVAALAIVGLTIMCGFPMPPI